MSALVACAWGSEWWRYPADEAIVVAVTTGDPLAIRVDKSHRLPADFVPTDLVEVPGEVMRVAGREVRVKRQLLEPLRKLGEAARAAGVDLAVLSGYRSFAQQGGVYAKWLKSQGGEVDATDRFSARPGHSEHQLGTAVDFTTIEIRDGIGPQFNRTMAARWLLGNAGRFGFRQSFPEGQEEKTGFMHEGWHWRYRGAGAE